VIWAVQLPNLEMLVLLQKDLGISPLDVCPFFGKDCGGAETRRAVYCFELELPVSM
jgi:hypothetical protein